MSDPYKVKLIMNQHVPSFTQGGTISNVRRVGIMIGDLGPYYRDFPAGADSPMQINSWIADEVSNLRIVSGAQ